MMSKFFIWLFNLCDHEYTEWEIKFSSRGYYDEEIWWECKCNKCGKVVVEEFEDNVPE